MRWFTLMLVGALMLAGILPATASDPDPGATASPSVSPSSSPPPPPTPATSAVFNYPRPGQPDSGINTELTRLLDQVPAGAQVVASFFVIQPNYPVVDALIAARGRGAEVRVVLDSGDGQSSSTNQALDDTYAKLAEVLGTDTTLTSFATQCPQACISGEPDSINHNKFVAMSRSGDLTDVVFQSTANVRSDGSGDAAWNAATVTSGNPELYASYTGYAADLAAGIQVPDDDYHSYRPPFAHGRSTPYYFPRTDGGDSISQTLALVDCAAAPTTVDVMASFFTRPKVRNRLNDMAQAGCGVRVIARTDTITRELCDSLRAPVGVRISDKPSTTKVGIHGKYLTIRGGFDGRTDARITWMGSHNFTRNALVRNDETFLLTDDAAVHDAFTTNFETIWTDPSVTSGCGRAGGVSEEVIEEEANEEVTPLVKTKQRVALRLPRKLKKKRTELTSVRTVEGQRLTTTATCRVTGKGQKLNKRRICLIKRPTSNPTLVLTPKKRQKLKVRLLQTADGSATLFPFSRDKDYTYRRPRK